MNASVNSWKTLTDLSRGLTVSPVHCEKEDWQSRSRNGFAKSSFSGVTPEIMNEVSDGNNNSVLDKEKKLVSILKRKGVNDKNVTDDVDDDYDEGLGDLDDVFDIYDDFEELYQATLSCGEHENVTDTSNFGSDLIHSGNRLTESPHTFGELGENMIESPPHIFGKLGDSSIKSPHIFGKLDDNLIESPHTLGKLGDTLTRSPHSLRDHCDSVLESPYTFKHLSENFIQSPCKHGSDRMIESPHTLKCHCYSFPLRDDSQEQAYKSFSDNFADMCNITNNVKTHRPSSLAVCNSNRKPNNHADAVISPNTKAKSVHFAIFPYVKEVPRVSDLEMEFDSSDHDVNNNESLEPDGKYCCCCFY